MLNNFKFYLKFTPKLGSVYPNRTPNCTPSDPQGALSALPDTLRGPGAAKVRSGGPPSGF